MIMGNAAEKTESRFTLETVNSWLQRGMRPAHFAKLGVVCTDGNIWIVNVEIHDRAVVTTLTQLAEYCGCSITMHTVHPGESIGYCLLYHKSK